MRALHLPARTGRLLGLFAVIALAALSAGSVKTTFGKRALNDPSASYVGNYVRPGLQMAISSAAIASDGTMTANVTLTDPKGNPLDSTGATTPGTISMSCTMAVLPAGTNDFTSYTSITSKSSITGASATQVWFEFTGSLSGTPGAYTYKFGTKAPSGFDATATHRIGCQASRDLSAYSLGTDRANAYFDFVPSGAKAATPHDVVRSASCNACHGTLNFHGGQAIGAEMCVLCHTKAASDPSSGNSLYFPVLVHKVHMGPKLPSVIAGTPYRLYGYQNAISDFSDVTYPTDPGRCAMCHDPKFGATQATNYYKKPTRAACGACHDDVNFATGVGHAGGIPQNDDTRCATCHILQGELPLDASILGAHIDTANLNQDEYDWIPGMVFSNLQVKNGTPGAKPTITFTLQDKSGKAIALSELAKAPGRLYAILAGPVADYGYTKFGTDQTTAGYISEDVTKTGSCDGSGACTFTFAHAIPTTAKGTYSVSLEGRRSLTILPGTTTQRTTQYGAHNVVANFSVDSSPVTARRQVVSLDKCNACHQNLSLHGANRDRIEACVVCHNPSETDAIVRPVAQNATDKATPAQSVDFAYMIHHIHGGKDVKAYTGASYIVVGYGGSHNDFSDVGFPAMSNTGSTGNIANCAMCHVNGSEQTLPERLNAVTVPQSSVNPMPRTTAVCTACHATADALAHAQANTTSLGESCKVCHGPNGSYSVATVHAQ